MNYSKPVIVIGFVLFPRRPSFAPLKIRQMSITAHAANRYPNRSGVAWSAHPAPLRQVLTYWMPLKWAEQLSQAGVSAGISYIETFQVTKSCKVALKVFLRAAGRDKIQKC